ncbi:MAG TPA: hypothetical protein VMV44_03240 [Rectinemataceae bacterium]|nr:hypothetical protein [Rectinemataceae bacterium]
MNPFRIELDLEAAIDLHHLLGEDDGRLPGLRKALRDYFYEHLTIAQLEEIAGGQGRSEGLGDRDYPRKQGTS